MTLEEEVKKIAEASKQAAQELVQLSTEQKNRILLAWADAIDGERDSIKKANAVDLKAGKEAGLSNALIDRLTLSDKVIDSIVEGLRDVANLPDPVGEIIEKTTRPNGLIIKKVRVPIGVVAIIYESRPNVTVDAAALCFKTSNAVVLRGGKEAINSNKILAELMQESGAVIGLPNAAVQLMPMIDREAVNILVKQDGLIDVVIPRGGEGLIRAVAEAARVPVIKHYKGNCHVFVDADAKLDDALRIIVNAKCQRPGVCNAAEHLLIHESIAKEFLPSVIAELRKNKVQIKGDGNVKSIVGDIELTTEADWYEEYLDLVIGIKIVTSTEEAVAHINKYGSHHSDAIISQNKESITIFFRGVDSAALYANASTRFTDGAEFGLGAEIGISTDKIHARGPMGLNELTTYKYLVEGSGQIR